jgi:hypothetical protein
MNPEPDTSDEMRAEYDIRRGIRGKYFLRYTQEPTITVIHTSAAGVIASITSATPAEMSISVTSRIPSYVGSLHRKIQPGNPVEDLVHAGENPSRG